MKKKKRKIILPHLLLLCLLPGTALPVTAEQGPVEMLQATTDQIQGIIKAEPGVLEDHNRLRELARAIIFPHVDFTALSRWVLGKYWRQATPAQREVFTNEFRELLLNTYLRSVNSYRGNTIQYQPLRQLPADGRVTVYAQIDTPAVPVIKAEFRLHRMGQQWLIYDVAVNGVSLVTTQRSTFAELIRRNGIEGVIAQLEQRNTRLREDTSSAPQEALSN